MLCVRAWNELSGDRHLGYGVVGPIPFTAIVRWAEVRGFDHEATIVLTSVLAHLERERLDRDASRARQRDTARPSAPAPRAAKATPRRRR